MWIARDKAFGNAIFAYAYRPSQVPFGTGHFYESGGPWQVICDAAAKKIGLKIEPGQCVEFELRPVEKGKVKR